MLSYVYLQKLNCIHLILMLKVSILLLLFYKLKKTMKSETLKMMKCQDKYELKEMKGK